MPPPRRKLVSEALVSLRGAAVRVGMIDSEHSSHPGLYAFYASVATWKALGLGVAPDDRPLYVGKAQNTLASRDIEGHFGLRERGVQSPTGSSTLRRSLAALRLLSAVIVASRAIRPTPATSPTTGCPRLTTPTSRPG
jgi:hypothetical protein